MINPPCTPRPTQAEKNSYPSLQELKIVRRTVLLHNNYLYNPCRRLEVKAWKIRTVKGLKSFMRNDCEKDIQK
jgi:hypothetical protein